jgi:hypothetical protein
MKALGRYDGSLQMFVQERRRPDLARLRFLRWLAERGRLEHEPAGSAGGEYAAAAGSKAVGPPASGSAVPIGRPGP